MNKNIDKFENEESKKEYLNNYNRYKLKFRQRKQTFKFRFYAEVYFFHLKLLLL